MAADLATLVTPAHTALVTQECQKGVLGETVVFPALAEIARKQMIPNASRIAKAARSAGVSVVHCVALRRRDGLGSNDNARVFGAARKAPVALTPLGAAFAVSFAFAEYSMVSRFWAGVKSG